MWAKRVVSTCLSTYMRHLKNAFVQVMIVCTATSGSKNKRCSDLVLSLCSVDQPNQSTVEQQKQSSTAINPFVLPPKQAGDHGKVIDEGTHRGVAH